MQPPRQVRSIDHARQIRTLAREMLHLDDEGRRMAREAVAQALYFVNRGELLHEERD